MTSTEPNTAVPEQRPLQPSALLLLALGESGVVIQRWPADVPLGMAELAYMAAVDANDGRDEVKLSEAFATPTTSAQELRSLVNGAGWSRTKRSLRSFPASTTDQNADPLPAIADGDVVMMRTPLPLYLHDGAYVCADHDGVIVVRFSAAELCAVAEFTSPTSVADGLARHRSEVGIDALDADQISSLLAKLVSVRLAILDGPFPTRQMLLGGDRDTFSEVFARHRDAQDALEAQRVAETGTSRMAVVPGCQDFDPPLGLGMVIAHAKAYNDGELEDFYEFRTDWFWADDSYFDRFTSSPAIYLFSNYMWNHAKNLELSAAIKARSPQSVTIHGGPDTPQYPGDDLAHFSEFSSVDIVVRGEGEGSLAETLDKLRLVDFTADQPDLSPLAGVEGICYRSPDGMVRNEDRDRIAELDIIPSPLLTGLFDPYLEIPGLPWLIESNRGCPYGCTFCDWGSATKSRIRKFDIDRIYAEIDFCARAKAANLGVCDANFGIFERDVDITRHIAESHEATGHPESFGANFAKNTKKHLQHIITIMTDADMFSLGTLSLQTMDPATLKEVRRTNIKTEKYDELADEMRNAGLPLMIELMMGLPGSTLDSMRADLQECIDREVRARMAPTVMLVNSPMNEPEYRKSSGIETNVELRAGREALVVQSASFTRDDYKLMGDLRRYYILFEELGVLHHISRVLRQESGIGEISFYHDITAAARANPHNFQHVQRFLQASVKGLSTPGSWAMFLDEVEAFVVALTGSELSDAMHTAFKVQHSLLPTFGRQFPLLVELEHDYLAWYRAMVEAKLDDRHNWTENVMRLSEYGPGTLTIEDPDDGVTNMIGMQEYHLAMGGHWNYTTELTRERLLL